MDSTGHSEMIQLSSLFHITTQSSLSTLSSAGGELDVLAFEEVSEVVETDEKYFCIKPNYVYRGTKVRKER
ncbi:hypothetical protein Tco_1016571 [Tanacetum coccineum]|uniref:Uncharacterized protein n=1 Tax=Tanacetum coccineum TaxID=301880 RepID=A0ABQ5FP19_9ASTR